MKYCYMNHRIRMKKPDGPVIVVQGEDSTTEANEFQIWVGGKLVGHVAYNPRGLVACDTHDVKAWVEFDETVELRPVVGPITVLPHQAKPVATAKLPNKKIKTNNK
jgi:hypothetical protein